MFFGKCMCVDRLFCVLKVQSQTAMMDAFDQMDADGSGFIEVAELSGMLVRSSSTVSCLHTLNSSSLLCIFCGNRKSIITLRSK